METTDEIARLITEWRAGVAEQARQYEAAGRAIDGVSVTETAAGGAILVTVASSGIPTDLRLGPDVGRMKPDDIAAQIMACLRRAQARLADRVGAAVADSVGGGGADATAAIVEQYQHRFPPPPDLTAPPPSPSEENADFGLSAMDADPVPPAHAAPVTPAAPIRQTPRPTGNDEVEDWSARPW